MTPVDPPRSLAWCIADVVLGTAVATLALVMLMAWFGLLTLLLEG